MRNPTLRSLCVLFFAALAALAAPRADAAEVYALLASGQKIQGAVPVGQGIRLEFPLAAGTEPRLSFTLSGAAANQPVSITEIHLYGPDGVEVFPPSSDFTSIGGSGKTGVKFKGWTSTQSGYHQLYMKTNARVTTQAKGKLSVIRALKFPIAGDDTSGAGVNPVPVPLQPRDQVKLAVKRVTGSAPRITLFKQPSVAGYAPGQHLSSKGSTTNLLGAPVFGIYEFTIGYQAAPLTGQWKGTVTIKPFTGGGPATLQLRNSPGIALSLLEADRFVAPTFGTSGAGVASDGTYVVVTSEQAGELRAQIFDGELAAVPTRPTYVPLTAPSDLSAGEQVSGHRFMYMSGYYYAAFSTASGKELSILRLRSDLVRDGFGQVVSNSPDPTGDFFLTGNLVQVSLGVFHPANGQTIHILGATDFGSRSSVSIGGTTYPQAQGGGAAWRTVDSVYELWTPDTLSWNLASDLHRVLYSAAWSPTVPDAKLVSDPLLVETMPTAVVVDPVTNVTIVHYVVADSPPPSPPNLPGSGRIHRVLFDASGVEIPGSRVTLSRASCNRPAACIRNQYLYLAMETPTGPYVERYQLLR